VAATVGGQRELVRWTREMPQAQPPPSDPTHTPSEYSVSTNPTRSVLIFFSLLGIVSAAAGFQFARHVGVHDGNGRAATAASSISTAEQKPDAGKAEAEELSQLAPQQQAERLLERAIHHQESSINLIRQDADAWRGHLKDTNQLFDLVHQALNSEDPRVRAAAMEIDLAANNLSKSPQSVTRLVQQIRRDPAERPLALWRIGALGNRGVQPQIVLGCLLTYARDPQEETRYWAVEGLAMLGGSASINPLLDRFAHDDSPRVRQHAGRVLAQSGMLTPEQRLGVVPDLFNLLDDDALEGSTRGWIYGALRMITGAAIGNDTEAWLKWWARHGTRRSRDSDFDDHTHA
jgi:HEAT repeat protein